MLFAIYGEADISHHHDISPSFSIQHHLDLSDVRWLYFDTEIKTAINI